MALYLLDKRNIDCNELRPSVVWDKKENITFQDLNEGLFDKALDFIANQYISRHILWKNIIGDKHETEEFLKLIKFLLNGKCSIVALDENNEIMGLVVMFPMRRDISSWQFISMKASHSACLKSYIDMALKLVSKMVEIKNYDTSCTMHLYVVAIHENKKFKWFKEDLILQAYKVTRSMNIPTMSIICESINDQERVKRVGMQCVGSLTYHDCVISNGQENLKIFENLSKGQHSATINLLKVGPKAYMCFID